MTRQVLTGTNPFLQARGNGVDSLALDGDDSAMSMTGAAIAPTQAHGTCGSGNRWTGSNRLMAGCCGPGGLVRDGSDGHVVPAGTGTDRGPALGAPNFSVADRIATRPLLCTERSMNRRIFLKSVRCLW
jgi:hypothetical protein